MKQAEPKRADDRFIKYSGFPNFAVSEHFNKNNFS